MKEAYVCDDDLFNAAAVRNARAVDDNLRELAPVVKLSRENITMIARYEHVSSGLRDWPRLQSPMMPRVSPPGFPFRPPPLSSLMLLGTIVA